MKSSNAMEHEGLVRALDFLEQKSITVSTLVTDRHKHANHKIYQGSTS